MIRAPALAALTTLAALLLAGCAAGPPPAGSATRAHALRLGPGADLRQELIAFVRERGLEAAAVASCAGSLTRATVRFADRPEGTVLEGKREIVSLSGTLSASGGAHLHVALSDGEGRTLGGHLLDGSAVYTTAEVVLVELEDVRFERKQDAATGYPELSVSPR